MDVEIPKECLKTIDIKLCSIIRDKNFQYAISVNDVFLNKFLNISGTNGCRWLCLGLLCEVFDDND